MKRVLLISLEYPPDTGGIARYLHGIYSRHAQDTVLFLDEHLRNRVEHAGKVFYQTFFVSWMYPRWLPALVRVLRLIRTEKITEIHCSHILPIGTLCYIVFLLTGIPYIVYLHGKDIALAKEKKAKHWLVRRILRHARQVVCNSAFTSRLVESFGVPGVSCMVQYPLVAYPRTVSDTEKERLRAAYNLAGKRVVLSVARLVWRKGIDLMLQAWSELCGSFPEVQYVVIGTGEQYAVLRARAHTLGIAERMVFAGAVDDHALAVWYSVADCFVLPVRETRTDVEGYGMVYGEAASYGVPSIATRVGGVPEAVIDGETGIVINPDNVQELVSALKRLLGDSVLREKLGAGARKRVLETGVWK